MKKYLILLILIILSSCGQDYGFTQNYTDSVCMPASSLNLEFLNDSNTSQQPQTSSTACCASSGLVSCCFGGIFVCVNGDTGVGCGCPSR